MREPVEPSALRAFLAVAGKPPAGWLEPAPAGLEELRGVAAPGLRLALAAREAGAEPAGRRWLLGDPAELRDEAGSDPGCCANAVGLGLSEDGRTLRILTSLVGLPPVFLLERPGFVAVASSPALLAGLGLAFDARGLCELARIGHPIDGRTLFRDLRMAPAGSRVELDATGRLRVASAWTPAASPPPGALEDFLELQIEAFERSVARLDLSRSFLSLTAGLDTRAVLAVLAREGRALPAVTLSGDVPSLDARVAGRLCRAYGLEHRLVRFGEAFERALPDYLARASRLSGGLASLEQAPEVHLYAELGDAFAARVSGNLGNQIGRGGTEGFSQRGADLALLAPELRAAASEEPGHWLERAGAERRELILLKREIPYTSVANYAIGSHFALQQTPYGSRELVEALLRRPPAPAETDRPSILRLRLRDLRHRFLGEAEAVSFQRRLIRRIGGSAASLPINWGWRAAGGLSLRGTLLGLASLLGMAATARGWDEGRGRAFWEHSRLLAIHDFRRMRAWLRGPLAELARDTLTSRAVRESGLFDGPVVERWLEEHYAGRVDHHAALLLALDLALAAELFDSRL